MEMIFLMCGAIAWLTTVTVAKYGPGNIFLKHRNFWDRKLGETNNPFNCMVCASFWIALVLVALNVIIPFVGQPVTSFFGILGFAMAIRGMSNEY